MKEKPKPKRLCFDVGDPVYETNLMVFVGYTHDEVSKWCKKRKFTVDLVDYGSALAAVHFWTERDGRYHLMHIKSFDWSIKDQTIVVHELFHAVTKLLQDRNMKLSDATQEPYAYLFDYYFEKLWTKLKVLYK